MTNTIYILCAAVGGTLFVGQFLLTLLGLGGGDHDLGLDHCDLHDIGHVGHGVESSLFFGMLSFRAIVAALTFFGLAGLTAQAAELSRLTALAIAAGAGLAAMLLVATVMRALAALRSDGSARIQGAVGSRGNVYLTIPANKSGFGKVQLDLQNRTVELRAVTFQGELPTGTNIVVVDVIGADTVEVIAAPETARVAHA